jgi:phenylacetate-CoA ligase
VRLEVAEQVFSDIMADMVALQKGVADARQTVLRLRAKITLVEPGSIERSTGKAVQVLDRRDQT